MKNLIVQIYYKVSSLKVFKVYKVYKVYKVEHKRLFKKTNQIVVQIDLL